MFGGDPEQSAQGVWSLAVGLELVFISDPRTTGQQEPGTLSQWERFLQGSLYVRRPKEP